MVETTLLAIESSGSTCGVGLSKNGVLMGEYSLFAKNVHDSMLAELCRRMLADHTLAADDVDAVVVSAGPGSFTGLRIGYSVAKGLCFGTNKRLVEAPTLQAFAAAAQEFAQSLGNARISVLIPSHKDIVYFQQFNANLTPINEALCCPVADALKLVSPSDVVCGTGAHFSDTGHRLSGLERLSPRFILRLGRKLLQEGVASDAANATPMYIQDFTPKTATRVFIAE